MPNIRISLVIPTRSRAEYLDGCLRSALMAAANAKCDVEIVVSDNASEDRTAEVVQSFESPLIRYVRQPQRLSMRQNFEAALGLSTGTHVIFIGDDDGVTPHGLYWLVQLIALEPAEIYRWKPLNYLWPDPAVDLPGTLTIRPFKLAGGRQRIAAGPVLKSFIAGTHKTYQDGGRIYHGCVSRALIERVQARTQGNYFWTSCPDVYASIANLIACNGDIVAVALPITLGGASPRSNGNSSKLYASTGDLQAAAEFRKFVEESSTDPFLGRLPANSASINLMTLDALQMALKLQSVVAEIDGARWLSRVAGEASTMPIAMQALSAEQSKLLLGPSAVLPKPVPGALQKQSEKAARLDGVRKGRRSRIRITEVTFVGGENMRTIAAAARQLDVLAGLDVMRTLPVTGADRLARYATILGRVVGLTRP